MLCLSSQPQTMVSHIQYKISETVSDCILATKEKRQRVFGLDDSPSKEDLNKNADLLSQVAEELGDVF